eukprot:scaffold168727_cov36-Attheya_sp.AAC.2
MSKSSIVTEIQEYLNSLKTHDKGFDFHISTSPNGIFQGVVWVTSHMHWNYERKQNYLNWPYLSVFLLNGYKKIGNACEAVCSIERQEAYRWTLLTLAEMCPKRPLSEIKCIFGDGISDSTLNNGSDLNAFLLGDVYHLLDAPNSVWKQVFKSSFALISSFLHTMVNSYNE